MDTLYIKSGKKYKKFGTTFDSDSRYMTDGLWLIQSHEHSKEYNNLSLRLCDLPEKAEVQKYVKSFLNKEVIINAFKKMDGKVMLNGISMNDYAESIVNEIYNESMKG